MDVALGYLELKKIFLITYLIRGVKIWGSVFVQKKNLSLPLLVENICYRTDIVQVESLYFSDVLETIKPWCRGRQGCCGQ